MKADKILIFIPGYNVEPTIGVVLKKLKQVNLKFDILYIDNNSSDKSLNIVKKNKLKNLKYIRNKKNIGYGGSHKKAFEYAFKNKYEYLIEYAGDYQYPHNKILELYKKAKESDYAIVFGSRITDKKHYKEMPKWKVFGNKIFNIINNWTCNFNVSEIHTGFRIYNLNLIKDFNYENCHNDYKWTMDSVIEVMKVHPKFGEISIKAFYHKDAQAPNFKQLFKVMSYMLLRGLYYKIVKD